MKNIAIAVAVAIVLGLGAWAFISFDGAALLNKGTATGTTTVATVNGEPIEESEFNTLQAQVIAAQGIDVSTLDASAQAQLSAQIVNALVSQKLLQQAVASSNITVSDADVRAELDTVKGQFEDQTAYENALAAQGLTENVLLAQIRTELTTQAYLEQELNLSAVTATEEEITIAYEGAVTEDTPPLEEIRDQVEAFIIQQKQQELINAYIDELRAAAEIEVL